MSSSKTRTAKALSAGCPVTRDLVAAHVDVGVDLGLDQAEQLVGGAQQGDHRDRLGHGDGGADGGRLRPAGARWCASRRRPAPRPRGTCGASATGTPGEVSGKNPRPCLPATGVRTAPSLPAPAAPGRPASPGGHAPRVGRPAGPLGAGRRRRRRAGPRWRTAPRTPSGTTASAARTPSRTAVATSVLVAACATVGPAATWWA